MAARSTAPWLVALALHVIRAVAWVVPGRDRAGWRREWEGEIRHEHAALDASRQLTWRTEMRIVGRALGSILDAAWLRRQFTRDNEWTMDVRQAWRQIRSRLRLHGAAALMLAAGIGSTAAGLSLLDRLVLRALPFDRPDQLVSLWQHNRATGNDREEVSPGNFLDWQEGATSFAAIGAAEPYSVDFYAGDRPEIVPGMLVTRDYFRVLGVLPAAGRLFIDDDFVTGTPTVAVISHAFWQRLGAVTVEGLTIRLDGQPVRVAGVLPAGAELKLLDGRGERDIWLPKAFQAWERNRRGEGWWAAIARLKPGISRQSAQAEMESLAARLAVEHPRTNAQTSVTVVPLETVVSRSVRPALTLLLGAAALVLLIACANVANLMLVRGAEREQEFLVRGALGASRARLARQVLVEAGVLATISTMLGTGVAWLMVRAVTVFSPTRARALEGLTLDAGTIGLTLLVGVMSVLVFGAIPAWQCAARRPTRSGEDSRWSTGGRRARWIQRALVVAEVAVAVMLAVGAGLLLRSFAHASQVHPGFSTSGVGVVQVFAHDRNDTADKVRAFHEGVITRLRQIPGVTDAGSVSAMPLISANINIESPLAIEGRATARPSEEPTGFLTVASPGYFSSLGITLSAGRLLADTDDARGQPVAVISRTLAQRYWPQGDAIGSWVSFRFQGALQRRQIVGIVEAIRHDAMELPARDELFIPFAQGPFASITFVFKAGVDPAGLLAQARAAVWAVDPLQTIYEDGTAEALMADALAPRRFALLLAAVFAVAAFVLAAVGVYATMSYTIGLQTREFGVRLALGASTGQIGRGVLRRGLTTCATGVAIGWPAPSWAAAPFRRSCSASARSTR